MFRFDRPHGLRAVFLKRIIMTDKEFIALVAKMRHEQQMYFKTRHPSFLNDAKASERSVDNELRARHMVEEKRRNPELFG